MWYVHNVNQKWCKIVHFQCYRDSDGVLAVFTEKSLHHSVIIFKHHKPLHAVWSLKLVDIFPLLYIFSLDLLFINLPLPLFLLCCIPASCFHPSLSFVSGLRPGCKPHWEIFFPSLSCIFTQHCRSAPLPPPHTGCVRRISLREIALILLMVLQLIMFDLCTCAGLI